MKIVTKDAYLKSMLGILRNYKKTHDDLPFLHEKGMFVNAKNFCVTCMTRKICCTHISPEEDTRL